jgi:hypothetical protein
MDFVPFLLKLMSCTYMYASDTTADIGMKLVQWVGSLSWIAFTHTNRRRRVELYTAEEKEYPRRR